MTPAEVKFQLDATLVALAEGGRMPVITSIHSVVVEGDTVHAGYDLVPGDVLFFEFERPQLVSPADVDAFVGWLAWGDAGETIH
jgi:hypothetical protein